MEYQKIKDNKDDVSAAANDYLKTLGYVSVAYAWIKVLEVCFNEYDKNKISILIKLILQSFILIEFYLEQSYIINLQYLVALIL